MDLARAVDGGGEAGLAAEGARVLERTAAEEEGAELAAGGIGGADDEAGGIEAAGESAGPPGQGAQVHDGVTGRSRSAHTGFSPEGMRNHIVLTRLPQEPAMHAPEQQSRLLAHPAWPRGPQQTLLTQKPTWHSGEVW
jgi:hypothetical protein